MDFIDDGKCFACGPRNPIGLKLKFRMDDKGRAVAVFEPGEEFQGFAGVVHGGIVCALLDEAMAWALILRGKLAVTVTLSARFRRPVRVGSKVTVSGELVKSGSARHVLRSEIRDASGELAAEAEGTFLVVSDVQPREVGHEDRT
ncbi:MAG TPA: PaaI family thioesterase [Firmicutes bacterium]|nr:PaaI family thioesterase [Bacillota bacterium]